MESGSGTEAVYKPQLWYFGMLQFLSDDEIPTESVDSLDGASLHEDQPEKPQQIQLNVYIYKRNIKVYTLNTYIYTVYRYIHIIIIIFFNIGIKNTARTKSACRIH